MKKRILTGDRPTGRLHVGHYVGSLKNRVALQYEYDSFIMLADVQALTDNYDHPEKIRDSRREVVLDYLSVGIDPKIATIFVQSAIPQIAELTIFYANLVTLARLERNPTVKAEMRQKNMESSVSLGFLMYPVSQAADITFIGANLVPVGKDQLPMIEQCQEIVDKFNQIYGQVLVRPEALVGDVPTLVGIDGNAKMSKSLNNAIYLSDTAEVVAEKVQHMYTDPNRIHANDPGKVEGNPVFMYHDIFNPDKDEVKDLKARYVKGTVGDVEVKQKLIVALNTFLDPIRQRREVFAHDADLVESILADGNAKTRKEAETNMVKIREAMKI